jgi:hypothetical protein
MVLAPDPLREVLHGAHDVSLGKLEGLMAFYERRPTVSMGKISAARVIFLGRS